MKISVLSPFKPIWKGLAWPGRKGQLSVPLVPGILLTAFISFCAQEPFQKGIEEAHNRAQWQAYDLVRFDLQLKAGGEDRLNASFWFDPSLYRARMETRDGSVVIFDGQEAYSWGPKIQRARFHVLTWPYFFAAPFKLSDPGSSMEIMSPSAMNDREFPAARLTFSRGVGDTPDDWYIIYKHPRSNLLHGMAYIVTYAQDQEEAEQKPHAIAYQDYESLDGIPVSRRWVFHKWNGDPRSGKPDENQPLMGKQIMEARITNVAFYSSGKAVTRNELALPEPEGSLFVPPENARLEPLPQQPED